MQIALASGKGGTGKTTLATNLALVASKVRRRVAYLDCDAKEPNCHIFLRPDITLERPIEKQIPQVDIDRCTSCGDCGKICQYSAIVCVGGTPIVFPELCHSCGGCSLVCSAGQRYEASGSGTAQAVQYLGESDAPDGLHRSVQTCEPLDEKCLATLPVGAIKEVAHPIGKLRVGSRGAVRFLDGTMDIGQHMGPPAIRAVKQAAPTADVLIIDAPPGTSCPAVEAVRGSDLVVLVTEQRRTNYGTREQQEPRLPPVTAR